MYPVRSDCGTRGARRAGGGLRGGLRGALAIITDVVDRRCGHCGYVGRGRFVTGGKEEYASERGLRERHRDESGASRAGVVPARGADDSEGSAGQGSEYASTPVSKRKGGTYRREHLPHQRRLGRRWRARAWVSLAGDAVGDAEALCGGGGGVGGEKLLEGDVEDEEGRGS